MAAGGTFSITSRSGGARWYGRISVPAAVARSAGIRAGMCLSASVAGKRLLLSRAEGGAIRFPQASGRGERRHVFEAATKTLKLQNVAHKQSAVPMHAVLGGISIGIPEEMLLKRDGAEQAPHRRSRSTKPGALPRMHVEELAPKAKVEREVDDWEETLDPVRALIADADRSGRQVSPVRIGDLVEFLRGEGRRVQSVNSRLFRVDGVLMSAAAVAELANEICSARGQPSFVLISGE